MAPVLLHLKCGFEYSSTQMKCYVCYLPRSIASTNVSCFVCTRAGLNCPLEGSLKYDLTCLASSLYVICTGEKLPETSEQLLEKLVGGNRMLPPTLQIVMICLQLNDIDSVWESAKVCIEAADGMDHSLIVRHDTVWPKVR